MKRLILFLILTAGMYGALPTNTTWEVRNAGTDTNGGGYKAGGPGTDYSNQNAAQFSNTDLASTSGTTNPCVVTSASHNFVSTDVDNIIQISAGTNWTASFYQIVSTSSNAATLDRACGSSATISGGTWAVGGALKTLSKLNTAMGVTNVVQHAYVKADSTYSISSGVTFNFALSSVQGADITGYTTTRPTLTTPGDGLGPTFQATAGSFTMITLSNNNSQFNVIFQNFILDGNAQTAMTCASSANNADLFRNIKALSCGTGFSETGFNFYCERCTATGMITNNGFGFHWTSGGLCMDCYTGDSSATGIVGYSFARGQCIRCIVANLSGGTNSDGFSFTALSFTGFTVDSAVCYNVTRTCFNYGSSASTSVHPVTIKNSICAKVGASGFCFDASNGSPPTIFYGAMYEDYNAVFPSAGTSYHLWTAGTHDVTLTSDPFVNGASQNFALTNTAGGGAAARAAGFPGTFLVGGTGFKDIGTMQHADPVVTPTQLIYGFSQ